MPPVIAAIPAALAVTAGAAVSAGAITAGSLLLGGATLALGTAQNILAGSKRRRLNGGIQGTQIALVSDPERAREWVYGETAVSGSLVFRETQGASNETLWVVISLQDTEADSIQQMFFRGDQGLEAVSFTGNDATGDYAGKLSKYENLGSESQLAISALDTASTKWTSNHRGRGVCHVALKLTFDSDTYPNGFPQPVFVVRGRKVNDPRTSTTAWSRNPALCILDYLRGITINGNLIGGVGLADSLIDIDSFKAAADVCDETITHLSGSGPRYTLDTVISTADDHETNLNGMLAAMAGRLVVSDGKIKLFAGEAKAATVTLTDDDLAGPLRVDFTRSVQDKANAITGVFRSPSANYELASYPPRIDAAAKAQDGGQYLTQELRLPFVSDHRTAQRISKIFLGDLREQFRINGVYKQKALQIDAWDTFTFQSDAWGVTKKMRLLRREINPDGTVSIVAREETDAKYDWTAATDEKAAVTPGTLARPSTSPTFVAPGDAKYADGTPIDDLKPGELGADVTGTNTAADTLTVQGLFAGTVRDGSNAAFLGLETVGAPTGDVKRDIPTTVDIGTTPVGDVEDGVGRARTGLNIAGDVIRDIPTAVKIGLTPVPDVEDGVGRARTGFNSGGQTLKTNVGVDLGGGNFRNVADSDGVIDVFDGVAVTFSQSYDDTPRIDFFGGGLSFSSSLPSGDQTTEFVADNLSLSGFTPRLKLTSVSSTTASATDLMSQFASQTPEWRAHKSRSEFAVGHSYRFRVNCNVPAPTLDGSGFPINLPMVQVGFYARFSAAGAWELVATEWITNNGNTDVGVNISDLGNHADREFGVHQLQGLDGASLTSAVHVFYNYPTATVSKVTATPNNVPVKARIRARTQNP
ncbi:MAG: hypothetical protein Tsb0010_10620 [Parvularculaceae bacterium]